MKSVVITGASTGIGRTTAEYLAQKGWKVFAGVRKAEDGEPLVKAHPSIQPIIIDVTQPDQIEAAASSVRTALDGEKLSGLINNAGIAVMGPLAIQPFETIKLHFDVHVLGTIAVTQAFLPDLGMNTELTGAPGRIVNISSFGGRLASPFLGAYCAAKHAIESLTHSMRRELLLFGIDAIVVAPGAIKTPIWDKAEEEEKKQPYKGTPWETSIEKYNDMFMEAGRNGFAPERVAETIETALTDPTPKAHYALGPDKLVNYEIAQRLPERWVDKGMGKRFELLPEGS
ncbi:MAG: SDR family NAD(P)-dependent oxidoreductase [Pseudomonadota bacterium]